MKGYTQITHPSYLNHPIQSIRTIYRWFLRLKIRLDFDHCWYLQNQFSWCKCWLCSRIQTAHPFRLLHRFWLNRIIYRLRLELIYRKDWNHSHWKGQFFLCRCLTYNHIHKWFPKHWYHPRWSCHTIYYLMLLSSHHMAQSHWRR